MNNRISIIAHLANVSPNQVKGFIEGKNIRMVDRLKIADAIDRIAETEQKIEFARQWLLGNINTEPIEPPVNL